MTKRVLFTALILFIIFDAVLFSLYFSRNPKKETSDNITVSTNKKEFKINNPLHQIKQGGVQILAGDPQNLILERALFLGYINGPPFINQSSQNIELPIILASKSGKQIRASLVLGVSNTDKIQTLFTKNGQSPDVQLWEMKAISEISPSLRKNDPLLIRIYTEYPSDKFIASKNCNEICKNAMRIVKKLVENNTHLVKGLQDEEIFDSLSQVGPPEALILYEK